MTRGRIRFAIAALAAAALAAVAVAQNIPSVGDATSPPPQQPGHALITAPHETVNPANGQVSLRFEVPLPAGRQLDPHFSFAYDSAGAHFLTSVSANVRMATQSALYQSAGWSYTVPILTWDVLTLSPDDASTCKISTDYVLQDTTGDRATFGLSVTGYASRPAYDDPCDSNYQQYATASTGDGWTASTTTLQDAWYRNGSGGAITSPDGTTYNFNASAAASFGEAPYSITDRNGNSMALSANASSALTYTDTLGRTVLSTSGFAQSTDTIAVSGNSTPYTVDWTSFTPTGTISETGAGLAPCPNQSGGATGPSTAVTSIATPEGAYTFTYDPVYGAVNRINFPNGGFVTYTWGLPSVQNEAGQFQERLNPQDPATFPCTGIYSNPVVTDRYVNDGTREVEHQNFQYTTVWGTGSSGATWTSKQTIVTTTDEVVGATSTTTYSYAARNLPVQPYAQNIQSTQMPVESSIATAPAGGAALRTVTEAWTATFPYLVTDEWTTLDNGLENWVHNVYNSAGQLTEKDEHDFGAGGPGPLLRKTTVAYASFPGRNIVDRPSSEVTYGPDGATRLAETDLGYDANANLFSDKRWVAGSSYLEADYSVDAYGNRLTAKDAAGSTTTFDYDNGFNAYPSTITDALGHTDQYAWNNASGTMASHTDQNSNLTSYAYSDGWGRLTQINFPDGGETTFAYTPATIETKRLQSANVWMDHFENFDGLGRAALSATQTSAGVWSRVDTCYNGTGEESFASYPYTSAGGIGAAACNESGDSFQFDALGRPTVTTHSDGTTFLTTYAGAATETQDEGNGTARVTRISQVNGLGQLSSVCEITGATDAAGNAPAACGLDLAATGFLTTYQHDALGNLLQVNQGVEQRNFSYDGLSRLLTASNPESGAWSYRYDSDPACAAPNQSIGDLISRTDARGIRTCYQLDALHRLTQKNYSDGTTPEADFIYDWANAGGNPISNPIGRLVLERTVACGNILNEQIDSYDPMGRIAKDWQATASGSSFELDYGYDKVGDRLSETNGAGVTFGSSFDAAGRPLSLGSSLVDAQHPASLANAVLYNALGQAVSIAMGNGVTETTQYDVRGRLTARSAGQVYQLSGIQYEPDGNLWNAPTESVMGWWSYAYDDLNRLRLSSGPTVNFTYAYDRYGNRWAQNVTAGSGPSFNQAFNGRNQIVGFTYDANGNLTGDGRCNYAYDAENELAGVSACTSATYQYDAEGRRSRTVTGSTEDTFYDLEGRPAAVFGMVNGAPQWWWSEVYLGERHLAIYEDSTTNFSHPDGLGTGRAWSNLSGAWLANCSSLPFGEALSCNPGDPSPSHFTGKVHDNETDFSYFGARYYSPQMGRFLTPDWSEDPEPIPHADLTDPQSLNLYSYVENNPVTMVDPDGHDFNLACSGTSDTCQGGIQGTTAYSTDANGNTTSSFTATVITSASLADPHSGNTATLNQNGVQITSNGQTSEGIFINNTPSADINGSGQLAGINFHIDSSDVKTGTLDAGTFTFNGVTGEVALTSALNAKGAFTYPGENLIGNPFHKGDLNFRFSSGAYPGLFDYGPSPHLLVPKGDQGSSGPFHIDSHTGSARHGACAWFHAGC